MNSDDVKKTLSVLAGIGAAILALIGTYGKGHKDGLVQGRSEAEAEYKKKLEKVKEDYDAFKKKCEALSKNAVDEYDKLKNEYEKLQSNFEELLAAYKALEAKGEGNPDDKQKLEDIRKQILSIPQSYFVRQDKSA